MKKIFKLILVVLATLNFTVSTVQAQSPEKMTYQAVVRNASNNLVTNTQVGIEINILQGTATGTQVYTETQTPTTNYNGLLTIEIGGQTGFDTITWANGPYFLETKIDPDNSGSYTITGVSQLLTVAYALHAKTAESITGGITEADPVYSAWDKSYIDLTNTPNITDTVTAVLDTTTQFVRTELDADPTNEIQTISRNGLTVTLSNTGGTYQDSVNTQNLSNVLTQNNDGGAKQIKNIADPTDIQDVATKAYVDQMMQIIENNNLIIVDFTANQTTTAIAANISFTDNSTINPTSWIWDFGDGNTATIQNPTHAYTSAGTYTVSLTASNSMLSKIKTKTNYIIVTIDGSGAGLTDIDDNIYASIIIGEQEWMAEDLKVTHYPNGDTIPHITDNAEWKNIDDNNIDDAYCFYNNDNTTDYGALYTYAAAIGDNWARDNTANQGICPDGWHLPTDAEWTILTDYLGGLSVAGGKMKEIGTTHWNNPNTGANNSSRFSALPNGRRPDYDGSFYSLGFYGYWWSATEYGSISTNSYIYNLKYFTEIIFRDNHQKSDGYSVRCVKN